MCTNSGRSQNIPYLGYACNSRILRLNFWPCSQLCLRAFVLLKRQVWILYLRILDHHNCGRNWKL
jgi:hypothetical protein